MIIIPFISLVNNIIQFVDLILQKKYISFSKAERTSSTNSLVILLLDPPKEEYSSDRFVHLDHSMTAGPLNFSDKVCIYSVSLQVSRRISPSSPIIPA